MFNYMKQNLRFLLVSKCRVFLFLLISILLPSELYAQTCTAGIATGFGTNFTVGSGGTDITETATSDCCFMREEDLECDGSASTDSHDEEFHFISGTICLMQTVIVGSMFNVYCGLLDNWGNVLSAAVTLYIVFYAIALIFKINNTTLRQGISKAIKLVLIYTFIQNPSLVYTIFYQGFLAFLDGVAVQLTCATSSATCDAAAKSALIGGTGGIFNEIDNLFEAIVGWNFLYFMIMLFFVLLVTGFGMSIAFFVMTGLIVAIRAFIDVLRTFIVAFLSITFLMMFAPIFVTALLFSPTAKFFVSWMSQLISYAVQPIIILAFLFLMTQVTAISTLVDDITTIVRAAGLLEACQLNPYADPNHPAFDPSMVFPEDKYGLYDDSGIRTVDNFYVMKVYYPSMQVPPTCTTSGAGTAADPCYSSCGSVAGTPLPCWTLGSDANKQIKFDLPGSSYQSQNLDLDASTPPQDVNCGLWYMQPFMSYFFGDVTIPIPQFRDPMIPIETTANFYGYAEPDSTGLVVGVDADGNDLFDYTLSWLVAIKIIFATIVAWFITSSLMSAFVQKVPELGQRLVQYQGSVSSVVITGHSALFSDITNPGKSASSAVEGRNQELISTSGNRSSIYMLGGSAGSSFNAAQALGSSINRVLSVIPGVGGVIDQISTSKTSQGMIDQRKEQVSNFMKGGGLIGMLKKDRGAKHREHSLRRRGIENNPLLAAEMAASGTSLGTRFGMGGSSPSGGGGSPSKDDSRVRPSGDRPSYRPHDDDDDPSGGGGSGGKGGGGGGSSPSSGGGGGAVGGSAASAGRGGASAAKKAAAAAGMDARKLKERQNASLKDLKDIKINKFGMLKTFASGIITGAGLSTSTNAAVNRGLQEATQTARAEGDTATLNKIHAIRSKVADKTEKHKKHRDTQEQRKLDKLDDKEEASNVRKVKRKSRNRFESTAIRELANEGKTSKEIMEAKEKREDRRFQKSDFKDLEDSVGKDSNMKGRKYDVFGAATLADEYREEREIRKAEKEGKSLEQATAESEKRRADKEFIHTGRTSAERAYRKEQIGLANEKGNQEYQGHKAKSHDEIIKDFEATKKGQKVVENENKETYRELLETSVNYEDRKRILQMRDKGIGAAEATRETELFREEQEFIEDARVASTSSLASSEILRLKSSERKFREEKINTRRRRRDLGYETDSLDDIKEDFEDNTMKGRNLAAMEMLANSETRSEKAIIREGMKKGMKRDEIENMINEKTQSRKDDREAKWRERETKDIEREFEKNKIEIEKLEKEFDDLNVGKDRTKKDGEESFMNQLSEDAKIQYQIIKNGHGKDAIIEQELKTRKEIEGSMEGYYESQKSSYKDKAFQDGIINKLEAALVGQNDAKKEDDEKEDFTRISEYAKEEAERRRKKREDDEERNS